VTEGFYAAGFDKLAFEGVAEAVEEAALVRLRGDRATEGGP
jgi:hypothetical protein